jgi:hypothetical protein
MARRRRSQARRPQSISTAPLWLVVAALAAIQWFVSDAASHQIQYEELAESVRNVFWLDEGLVYDGISSNVGWYGLLLITYKLAGFSLITAKVVRLVLHVVALGCLAALLRRAMSPRAAVVPLLAIGLSPALLYFNSLQTSFGIDIAYAAFCLFLMASVRFDDPRPADLGRTFAAGVAAAIGAASYPTVLLYLPSLVLVWVWLSRRPATIWHARWQAAHAASALAGVLLPAGVIWTSLQNPQLLVHDPVTKAGLFRGGGGDIAFDAATFAASLQTLGADLFVRGGSYYFALDRPDFAGLLGIAGVGIVAAMAMHLVATRRVDRVLVAAAALLLVINLVVPGLSLAGPPGLRRATGVLAAFFGLFALVWHYWTTQAARSGARSLAIGLCLVVPAGAALKLPALVSDVRAPGAYRNLDWFAIRSDPDASLEAVAADVQAGQPLKCPVDPHGRVLPCRYQEIYAALAGWFRWTAGTDPQIRAIDWKTGRSIVLLPSLWTTYYYPH